jgi:hypothetical protein
MDYRLKSGFWLRPQPQLDKPADGFTFTGLPRWQRLGVVSPTSFLVSM